MSRLQEVESFWARVCFDPDYKPEGRFHIYRELVFNGMADVLRSICPVAYGILGPEECLEIFWEFLRNSPPKTAILRRLPLEVSRYLKKGEHCFHEKYPFLGELMDYEYLEVQVRFAPEDQEITPPGTVRLNPAHALRHYTWPVHFISETFHDKQKLPRGDFFLFLWRDPENLDVKFMEVNPMVASLLELWERRPRDPVDSLREIGWQHNMEASQEFLKEGDLLVRDLISKKILFHT